MFGKRVKNWVKKISGHDESNGQQLRTKRPAPAPGPPMPPRNITAPALVNAGSPPVMNFDNSKVGQTDFSNNLSGTGGDPSQPVLCTPLT